MPNMSEYQKYREIKEKVLKFYRLFFYGEIITPLENEIESSYLEEKLKKWTKYQANSVKNSHLSKFLPFLETEI